MRREKNVETPADDIALSAQGNIEIELPTGL
jgi:hypothetical protein